MQLHCPLCGRLLWHHGCYKRNAVTDILAIISIHIFRMYCPDCRKTFSLIPAFLKPHRPFLMCIFEEIVYMKVILGKTYIEITGDISKKITGGISLRTISRYLRCIKISCKDILLPLEAFLCRYIPEKELPSPSVDYPQPYAYVKRVFELSSFYSLIFEKYLGIQHLTSFSYFADLNARVAKSFML